MAGSFFNGVMGGFSAYSVFNSPPPPSSAAGQFGGGQGAAGASGANGASGNNGSTASGEPIRDMTRVSTGQVANNYTADAVKSVEQSQTGNAARAYTPSPETPPSVSPDVRVSTPPKDS